MPLPERKGVTDVGYPSPAVRIEGPKRDSYGRVEMFTPVVPTDKLRSDHLYR